MNVLEEMYVWVLILIIRPVLQNRFRFCLLRSKQKLRLFNHFTRNNYNQNIE